MNTIRKIFTFLAIVGVWSSVSAQSLTITNGVQTYTALTNTTVTMSNRCELRLTATTNPIPGCTINLNSSDAWFFLPNIRPSVVSSAYLSQIKVNGAAAVVGNNCRLDQYVMGSVIIPQAPNYNALQVFSAQNFLGVSSNFLSYTYYNTPAALGAMNQNIGSFRLKRGYAATFAQNTDGTGASKVYVAQDGDLEVGVMPANLDHRCSFVRVFPWRWTGKKGWVGGVGANTTLIDPLWNYDYDNVTTSTLDIEYVPMRDTAFWDDYANINAKQKSTEAIAFNEPDQSNQANMTVAAAIAQWPSLMQSGLRVGAPAVSSSGVAGQGLDWLYSFMSQATNLGYRVDYIPVHLYKCSWSTTQVSNYLAGVYQTTGKPIWLTEFNDTDFGSCSQSQSSEATAIGNYISMMESCPFVERYSVYEYFDPSSNLNLVTTNSTPSLTPAGVVYHNQQSTMAYAQTVPPAGNRGIAQFQFETNTLDNSGFGNNGFAVGIPAYTAGHSGQAVSLDGTNNFIQLPPSVATSNAFTFAAWINWSGGANWQRVFDFGNGAMQYMFLTPSSASGTLRFAISTNSFFSEQIIETTALPVGQWRHVALTISGTTVKLYTNGVLAATSSSFTLSPATFKPALNYLGKSQFTGDPLFRGQLDEVFIADTALSAAQIAALKTNLPPQLSPNLFVGANATPGQAYSSSVLVGTATDPNPGDTLTFSKASGPAWLVVAANGTLSGTPGTSDAGTNNFTVRVSDAVGASAFASLTIKVNGLLNGGFEQPSTGTYIYNPSGGGWTFTAQSGASGSGVTANNSGFTANNTNAPEGVQCAFLQGVGPSISQAISGLIAGAKYNVTFAAALRAVNINGGQTWQVRIDNTVNGDFRPAVNATNYVDYSTNFIATATTHTLKFVGTDIHGGDNTVFIDNVRLTFVSPPPPPSAPLNLAAVSGDGQVALTWNASATATGYNVKSSTTSGGGYATNASPATTSYTDFTATNGVTYYYVVSAVNSGGEGTNSAEVIAHPVSLSQLPVNFSITNNGVQFSWPSDHTGWRLMMNTNDLGNSAAWQPVLNSSATNQIWLPLDATQPNVFFRLVYP